MHVPFAPMLDLRLVRSFAEVAERGTIAAAAEALGYTAPAVSQHVAKLEADLAVPLFDRAGGRLRLSDAGAALLPHALALLDLAARARDAATTAPHRRRLAIAGFGSALAVLVLPALEVLRSRHHVTVIEADDDDALRELRLGHVDLALTQTYDGEHVERSERLDQRLLARDRLRLVLPPHLPCSTRLADLGAVPFLLNGPATRCEAATRRILAAAGIEPPIAANVSDNRLLLDLVAAGQGATIAPELLIDPHRADLSVADEDLRVRRSVLAVTRDRGADRHGDVVEELRRHVGARAEPGPGAASF